MIVMLAYPWALICLGPASYAHFEADTPANSRLWGECTFNFQHGAEIGYLIDAYQKRVRYYMSWL